LRQDVRLVDKKGTHHVKILTEKITAVGRLASEQAGKLASEQVGRLIALFEERFR